MITSSIIQKSQLEGALRLDAEYYQPVYLKIRSEVKKHNPVTLGGLCSRFKKGIFDIKADTYVEKGVPFIRISNLKNGFIDKNEMTYISEEANEKEIGTCLGYGDIVLSKTAYPSASFVNLEKVNISQDIIGLSLKKEYRNKVLTSYLTTFLNTKHGLAEMEQWFQGNIQMHLALPDAKTIFIPIPNINWQERIDLLFLDSLHELENSKELYQRAEDLLLEELGLKDFEKEVEGKSELFWTVNLSDVEKAERIDAEYFQPKYEKLISKLKTQNSKLLTDVIELVPAKFDATKEQNTIFNYIELADVDSSIGIIGGSNEVLGEEAPSRAKRVLKKYDVIVSSIQGSLEKAALVDKAQEGFLASTGFFQFRSKVILPEVILVLAKSPVLQMQLEKQCAGTILTAVPHESLKNIVVPILPLSTQQKIADLVQKSHQSRQKSKELLEEAKRKVEEMIEKGGY